MGAKGGLIDGINLYCSTVFLVSMVIFLIEIIFANIFSDKNSDVLQHSRKRKFLKAYLANKTQGEQVSTIKKKSAIEIELIRY